MRRSNQFILCSLGLPLCSLFCLRNRTKLKIRSFELGKQRQMFSIEIEGELVMVARKQTEVKSNSRANRNNSPMHTLVVVVAIAIADSL